MIEVINIVLQIAMVAAFVGIIYCVVQVVDVIREERERLMWYRNIKAPAKAEDENDPAQ